MARKRKRVTLICVSCRLPFEVLGTYADQGRKYCGRECLANDKGFYKKRLLSS